MNEDGSASNIHKIERKTIEKNRRILMKNLCSQLASIIPNQVATVSHKNDQIDLAVGYIKELEERIRSMKDKLRLMSIPDEMLTCNVSVSIEEGDSGSALELIDIRGISNKLRLSKVVSVLSEEGLAVVNVSFSSTKDHSVFLTIHTQVKYVRFGVELAKLRERLNGLLN